MNYELQVRVPGTSANLGPGFDILGLALKIYNTFHFKFTGKSGFTALKIDLSPLPFTEKEDLVKYGYEKYFLEFLPGVDPVPYDVLMDLSLPLKGGLGSSASALVAGFCAARFIHQKEFIHVKPVPDEKVILSELSKIEGHPDNTTPAYTGGVILAYYDEDNLIYYRENFPDGIKLYLFVPSIEISTNDSRKKLPDSYPVSDVIFNMSRIATWMKFLNSKDYSDLKLAVQDKVHTPYRIGNIEKFPALITLIEEIGAVCTLSGSGPTILIYVKSEFSENFLQKFREGLVKIDFPGKFLLQEVEVDNDGVFISC